MRRNSHMPPLKKKAPSFLHTLRIVERAYSRGADVGPMMAIVIIDVNSRDMPIGRSRRIPPSCHRQVDILFAFGRGKSSVRNCEYSSNDMRESISSHLRARLGHRSENVAAPLRREKPARGL